VVVLAHVPVAYELAARSADVVLVTPHDVDEVASITAEVRAAEAAVGRSGPPLLVLADLLVLLEDDPSSARAALDHLDELNGDDLRSDAAILTTTPIALADQLVEWHDLGLDGFRLRPARLPTDLDTIADHLVPELVRRGRFPSAYHEGTLRSRLGLERPLNRYATQR
jgi:alkanesulfonate monooxygenase SsuD/methylene tetrahydromethanopterin reductase-like flavin-dependent oxidoreductase (luciferase family)